MQLKVSDAEEEKWAIFKNVFVVKPEMLIVDGCAAAAEEEEEQKPISLPKRREWRGLSGGRVGIQAKLIHATFLLTEFVFVYCDVY